MLAPFVVIMSVIIMIAVVAVAPIEETAYFVVEAVEVEDVVIVKMGAGESGIFCHGAYSNCFHGSGRRADESAGPKATTMRRDAVAKDSSSSGWQLPGWSAALPLGSGPKAVEPMTGIAAWWKIERALHDALLQLRIDERGCLSGQHAPGQSSRPWCNPELF
jgi:hypothetical protein